MTRLLQVPLLSVWGKCHLGLECQLSCIAGGAIWQLINVMQYAYGLLGTHTKPICYSFDLTTIIFWPKYSSSVDGRLTLTGFQYMLYLQM